ncbi:MAG TPA: YitT family protein, partial [Flavobacteriales bacterium]|nr:YitT family protein [Flavobacteriales bacterium]
LKSFLMPEDFIDGGATGLALLGTVITPLPLPVLLLIMNAPFIWVAYRTMGREFAWRTALSIGALALVTATVTFPDVTHDKLLIAVFGGFFLGAGIGLAVRGGSVIDGTEVVAIWLSRKLHVTIGDVITVMNVFIFAAAAKLISVETALYSMVTYLAASRTVDFVVEGIEEYIGITIISPKHDEVKHMLVEDLGRGVTIYQGKRGYRKGGGSYEVDIIYCVITRLEIHKVTHEVERIDPNAFLIMSSVKDITGGIVKKRRFKH